MSWSTDTIITFLGSLAKLISLLLEATTMIWKAVASYDHAKAQASEGV